MTYSSQGEKNATHQVEQQPPCERPRVLIIAEKANPDSISIHLRGWCHSRAIADVADVHIATLAWNADAFRRANFTDFTPIDTTLINRPIKWLIKTLRGGKGKGWTLHTALMAFEYYYFEFLVWKQLGERIRAGDFDIVHRVIPSSPTAPSTLAQKCKGVGVPFILGPLNGGLPWPKEFNAARHQEKEWLSYVRDFYRLMPGYKATRENAAAIIVGSQSTLSQVDKRYQPKCIYFPANAVDTDRFDGQRQRVAQLPLKLVFVGRLVPYKGGDMLIEAAAPLLRENKVALEIIGDGPEQAALEKQVRDLGLTDSVTFAGRLPQTQLKEHLANSDVFAFPSIREFGGAVVIEAMALGLTPVVVGYGGPGEMVTASTGYKVPLGRREEIVANFRQVLNELVVNPEKVDSLGKQARQRVLDKFTWGVRAQQTLEVYQWVLDQNRPKPVYNYES
ncbi:MAG: glycosyltransferase family 4 protein [Cyanobacteria bacterium J06607_13]